METVRRQPSRKGPPRECTGDAWLDALAVGEEPSRLRANVVHFAPGARTAWHCHAVGQTIHVTEGIGLAQARGGDIVVMHPGDTVHSPPGEWHWHGAAPDSFMTQLTIREVPANGEPGVEWGEHVTDDEYAGLWTVSQP